MTGQSLGTYDVLHEIGRGGMGVVYLAEHRHLRRKAAIKVLLREFTDRPELLQRFFTEARASTVIDHPGIVQVLDCDVHPSGQLKHQQAPLCGGQRRIGQRSDHRIAEQSDITGARRPGLTDRHV